MSNFRDRKAIKARNEESRRERLQQQQQQQQGNGHVVTENNNDVVTHIVVPQVKVNDGFTPDNQTIVTATVHSNGVTDVINNHLNGHVVQNGNCLTVPETVIEDQNDDAEMLNAKNHSNGGFAHTCNNKNGPNPHADTPSDKQVFSMQNTVRRIENLMDKKQNGVVDNFTADSGYIKSQ